MEVAACNGSLRLQEMEGRARDASVTFVVDLAKAFERVQSRALWEGRARFWFRAVFTECSMDGSLQERGFGSYGYRLGCAGSPETKGYVWTKVLSPWT